MNEYQYQEELVPCKRCNKYTKRKESGYILLSDRNIANVNGDYNDDIIDGLLCVSCEKLIESLLLNKNYRILIP